MTLTRSVLGLVFALALCVPGFGRAEGIEDAPTMEHPDDFDHAINPQQKLADKFGVEGSQIASLRDEKLGYGEIDHTLTLAERLPGGITDENVATILEMRQEQGMGWGQIAHAQGTTLGNAKKEFPVQPEPEPTPHATPEPQPAAVATTGRASTAQPKSLVRSGKSTTTANGSTSKSAHGGKSSVSRGPSSRSGKTVTTSATAGRSGHAYGRGDSSGSKGSSAKANGKAKGHK